MKLRLRSLRSKETQKLQVPDDCSLHQFTGLLANHLSCSSSSLRLSLNGNDDLPSQSPGDSLLSIGITSGDLIYYDLSPAQRGLSPSENYNKRDFQIYCEISDGSIENETVEMDVDCGSGFKGSSEPYFLKRVLCEEMGTDFSDTKLVFLAVHAVFLESGFVGFDPLSGLRVDFFDILKEQSSIAFTTTVSYTLPELLACDDGTESVVLKFQTLGHYVNVYGSLSSGFEAMHKLEIDKSPFVPALGHFWAADESRDRPNGEDSAKVYAVKVVFELWKRVKDGLVLPLMIDLCEKTGLDLPPCLMRLPADLKLQILELSSGRDTARVACVCKEMRYLCSNDELWKGKYMSEYGSSTVAGSVYAGDWKGKFVRSWEISKKRRKGWSVQKAFGIELGDLFQMI